ncbi:MAG: PEP-CTERM sorting domain-containing protein [Rubripirellula sp.]
MTGWLNSNTCISETTLGSFLDLGYTTASSVTSVPEPASTVILAIFSGGAILSRRKREQPDPR